MDAEPLIASDGLLARKSGEWAKRKLHFLRNYCGITTVAMRKKWRLRYLNVMAGPGRCKNTETGAEFPGSPFVALDYGFNDFLFVEQDAEMANALEERIRPTSEEGTRPNRSTRLDGTCAQGQAEIQRRHVSRSLYRSNRDFSGTDECDAPTYEEQANRFIGYDSA